MCKIRTIILNNAKEITCDFIVEVKNIEINIIDRPAFCIFCPPNSNGYNSILFKFSNLNEGIMHEFSNDSSIEISVGQQSGCVYSFQYRDDASFIHINELEKTILKNGNITRYQNNVLNFRKLIDEIRKAVNNQLKKQLQSTDK